MLGEETMEVVGLQWKEMSQTMEDVNSFSIYLLNPHYFWECSRC